jgi:predicted amidohydrolase YtcJ
MGNESLSEEQVPGVEVGELKVMLDEDDLPDLESLVQRISLAHTNGRAVAFHCVSRIELLFALAALNAGGVCGADRLEHGAVIPADVVSRIVDMDLAVVTQPTFIAERGDRYIAGLTPAEHDELYRVGTIVEQGVCVALSSDAPYGNPDPWKTLSAAVHRTTTGGRIVGQIETVSPELAYNLMTRPTANLRSPAAKVTKGSVADLCLMNAPWHQIRNRLDSSDVVATLVGGDLIHQR